MNDRLRKTLWFLLSTAILAGLIYLSDPREFIDVLLSSHPGYVSVAIACGCFTLFMWSVVWHRFFGLVDIGIRFQQSIRLLLAGTFLNAVTPLGRFGGEPFVAHLITRRTDATFAQALSGVSSADLSNALPFVTFGTISIAYLGLFVGLQSIVADIALWAGILVVLAMLAIYLLWFGGLQRLIAYADDFVSFDLGFGRWQPYINSLAAKIREVLSTMRDIGDNPREVGLTLLISHLAVMGHIGAVYFTLLSVGVDPVAHTIFLVVALSAFLTFSPTPGSMGTFEAGFAALIVVFFPVSGATATSIAVLYRVGTYLPGVVLGYVSLLSLRRLQSPTT